MSRKKEAAILVSQQDEAQARHFFEHYHSIASNLRAGRTGEQASAALSEINSMPEAAQAALLKILAREHDSDAADVLAAIHEFSLHKSIRKEARRSLIQLEAAKIRPHWSPPAGTPLITQPVINPPRFWKGTVSLTREQGEVELNLYWELGEGYNEARVLSFLLDFWQAGVKDFFTRTGTKRRLESDRAERQAQVKDLELVDCTLAEGRRLVEEALSVNTWRHTSPHKDYRLNLPTINQFLWQTLDSSEDRGLTFIHTDLEPDEVVLNYIGSWCLGDFGLAYDLLTNGSPLRDELTRDEWIARRRAWADEAHPSRFQVSFVHEGEARQSALWLPAPLMGSYTPSRKEMEVGWSLEVSTTPLSGTLKEMPMGTVVNKATGRHWFWTRYTLVQEEGVWRIRSMSDEGASAQGLSIPELQKRLEELKESVGEKIRQNRPRTNDPDSTFDYLREVLWDTTRAMHYSDALMVKLPLDHAVYAEAAAQAEGSRAIERATVYLERMAQRFPEGRGDAYRRLGTMLSSLENMYREDQDEERAGQFFKLAEAAFRNAIAADHAPLGYALLAELLISREEPELLPEAEDLLQQAQEQSPNRAEETVIQACLGNIAIVREQPEEALRYYRRAAEISPDYPGIWYNIGHIQYVLERYDEAEGNLRRALEVNPELRVFVELSSVYMAQQKMREARETLEQGLRTYPDSAHLRAMLAMMAIDSGDRRRAQTLLAEAERINPNLEIVKLVRQTLDRAKKR